MERTEVLNMMGELKLFGMRGAYLPFAQAGGQLLFHTVSRALTVGAARSCSCNSIQAAA